MYNVYKIGHILLASFSTKSEAQNFINNQQYDDISLSIVYE